MGPSPSKSQILLMMEPNPEHASLLRDSLHLVSSPKCELVETDNLPAAICALRELKPLIILANLDSVDNDKATAIAKLRRHGPQSRLVITSSNADPQQAVTVIQSGADEFMLKDRATLDKLPVLFRRWLKKCSRRKDTSGNTASNNTTVRLQKELNKLVEQLRPLANHTKNTVDRELHTLLKRIEQLGKHLGRKDPK